MVAVRLSGERRTALWRDARVLAVVGQTVFVVALVLLAALAYANMMRGLERLGLRLQLGFLSLEAGFGISEGIAYNPGDSYGRAFVVGVVNTLRVSVVGILLATVVGLFVGIGRLSSNWLIRSLSTVYVEAFRNTPLLLQLIFWYTGVILKLPPVRQSLSLADRVYLNQRGVFLPRPVMTETAGLWGWALLASALAAAIVYVWRRQVALREDRPAFPFLAAAGVFIAGAAVTWYALPSPPLEWQVPVLQGFNFRGGIQLSPEFAALLVGLVLYTGAFIAEVVRGGIQSIPKGQWEAAQSLGLRPGLTLYLVILPQALRIIIPPLTSQYLNLVKNSSLATAIGFPDMFNIGVTIMNQTGQSLPMFGLIMAAYLSFSLVTALIMNWYNRRFRLVER